MAGLRKLESFKAEEYGLIEPMWKKFVTAVSFIFAPQFFAVVFSHLMTDLYVGQRSIYLAYISGQLGYSNATLGLITTIAVMLSGLSQPVFGWLADKVGPRRMIIFAMLWIAVSFTLSIFLPMQIAPVLIIAANLGAGMYHPAGVNQATLIGRIRMSGKETTAASYFFLFGQLGFFFGPLLGGLLLRRWDQPGLLVLSALAIPSIIFAWRALKNLPNPAEVKKASESLPAAAKPARPVGLAAAAIVLAAAFQSWAQQNITAFMPKHMVDLGLGADTYGLLASVFIGGTVVGNLAGGALADRLGKKWVIMLGMGLGSLPLLFMGLLPYSAWWGILLFFAGMFVGSAYSVLVVLGQRLAPGGGALASGLVLGFIFSSGALGAALTGVLADAWGFAPVYYFTAALALAGGLLAFLLPEH